MTVSSLSEKHARFVAEYAVDRNAAAAAVRAGFIARQASQLMRDPEIVAAIEQQQAPRPPAAAPDTTSLIAEAESARALAESAGQAGAAVQAINLKAKLAGKLVRDEPPEPAADEATEFTNRDIARAIIGALREAGDEAVSAALRLAYGGRFAIALDGEVLLRVPAAVAEQFMPMAHRAEPPVEVSAEPHSRPQPDKPERRVGPDQRGTRQ